MILLRYEVRVRVRGDDEVGRIKVHRRFLTHDGASYCLNVFRSVNRSLEARIYDRKKREYLGCW